MTTLTEIADLKADMDVKFQKVYDGLAGLQHETHGIGEDVKELRTDLNAQGESIASVNAKLDKLLELYGIPSDGEPEAA